MKRHAWALLLAGVVGCGTGGNGDGDAGDARADVDRADAARDATSADASADTRMDAPGDIGSDAFADTRVDASADGGDSGAVDASAGDSSGGMDAGDAGADASAGGDASADGFDAGGGDASDEAVAAGDGAATDAIDENAADAADDAAGDAIDDATNDAADDALDVPAGDAADDAAGDAADDAFDDAAGDALDVPAVDAGPTTHVRILTGNLTTGNLQSYDPGQGIRIFQAMHPDIALIQEFNYGTDSPTDIRTMVDMAFGPEFSYARGAGQIPNGVASRYPILASGSWTDPRVTNRDFVWTRIDVPGPVDLWAISVHLLTSNATERNLEAMALVSLINANVPAADYVVLGGDFNTSMRMEPAMLTLSSIFVTAAPWPADQNGNGNTNGPRTRPYDWVLTDAELTPLRVPGVFGSSTYPDGLVFDTRVYTPLSDVPPALVTDSDSVNQMQHQAVVKDFAIPE